MGRSIENRIESVSTKQDQISERQERARSDINRLTEEVAQTQADLQLTREQLSEVVRERLATAKDRDTSLFRAVGEAPLRADILDALIRAQEMGIIPDQGCRVDISGTGSYLRFKPEWESSNSIVRDNQDFDTIELTLEEIDATELRTIHWDKESSASDIALAVAEAMQASGTWPGDTLFDAGRIFASLAALLTLGHDSTTRGAVEPVRHIIQLCPPQWAVCDDGVYAVT